MMLQHRPSREKAAAVSLNRVSRSVTGELFVLERLQDNDAMFL